MLKKTITYTDYNGVQRAEDFYFNLNKVEVTEMEASVEGGYANFIEKIAKSENLKELIGVIKVLILNSYGEKSADGKRFIKVDANGIPLSKKFEETEAFVELYMELATDANKCSEFVNGILPVMENTQTTQVVVPSNLQ